MDLVRSYMKDKSTTKLYIALFASAGLAYTTYITTANYLKRKELLVLIAQKRRQRDEGIATLRKQLENGLTDEILARRKEIVQLGFDELRSRLQNDQLTAVEVLEAFQWRALEIQEKTNFACQFVLEARKWAEELDAKYGRGSSEKKPPLFGIPFSNKECHNLGGYDATAGFAQFIGQPVPKDGEVVAVLKHAGAIPFVLTNVPITTYSTGCSNPIFGATTNPYNPERTSGGSTGGVGPVIALRGSPFGMGGDIGGSVRTPAHCCGICGLKPSIGRLWGVTGLRSEGGITAVRATIGPMGPDVDSLVWFMRGVCTPESLMYKVDANVVPIPFNEEAYNGTAPLTIGYYDHDNWMTAAPACRRAVHLAKEILESQGHRLIPLSFPFTAQEMREFMEVYVAGIFPDGGAEMADWLSRDLVDPAHQHLANFFSWPIWYRKLKSIFARSPYWRTIYAGCESNTKKLRKKYEKIDAFRHKFYKFWRQFELDCVICPVAATPALPVDVPPQLFCIYWSYCAVYNLLNYAAGSVKCTKVSYEDEKEALEDPKMAKGGLDENDEVSKMLRKCQKGSARLPVGVQVVTLPFREELCLRVMKIIENGYKE